MYLNKVAFSEMIWRKTINLLPDLVQCKIKRGHCVSAKNQKCWKNESTWVSQKRSCVKNTVEEFSIYPRTYFKRFYSCSSKSDF